MTDFKTVSNLLSKEQRDVYDVYTDKLQSDTKKSLAGQLGIDASGINLNLIPLPMAYYSFAKKVVNLDHERGPAKKKIKLMSKIVQNKINNRDWNSDLNSDEFKIIEHIDHVNIQAAADALISTFSVRDIAGEEKVEEAGEEKVEEAEEVEIKTKVEDVKILASEKIMDYIKDIPNETINTQYTGDEKYKEVCRSQVPFLCGDKTNQKGFCRRTETDCNFLEFGKTTTMGESKFIYQTSDASENGLYIYRPYSKQPTSITKEMEEATIKSASTPSGSSGVRNAFPFIRGGYNPFDYTVEELAIIKILYKKSFGYLSGVNLKNLIEKSGKNLLDVKIKAKEIMSNIGDNTKIKALAEAIGYTDSATIFGGKERAKYLKYKMKYLELKRKLGK